MQTFNQSFNPDSPYHGRLGTCLLAIFVATLAACVDDADDEFLFEDEELLIEDDALILDPDALHFDENSCEVADETLTQKPETETEESLDVTIQPQAAPSFYQLTVNGSGQLTSVPLNGKNYYKFTMTQGVHYTVHMHYYPWGGDYSKDPDLYTHNQSSISTINYLCRPFLGPGQSEHCTFIAPYNGTNYAMVHGFTDAAYYIYVTSS